MASALKDWWRKLNEIDFVEQDDALYCRRNPLLAVVISAISVFSFFILFIINSGIKTAQDNNGKLIMLIMLFSYIAGGLLLYAAAWRRKPFFIVDLSTDTLRLSPGNAIWPLRFRVPLSTLRNISVRNDDTNICVIRCELTNGQVKTARVFYQPAVKTAVVNFLQRKLPASVKFTAWP